MSKGRPKRRTRISTLTYVVLALAGAYGAFAIVETPSPYRRVIVGLVVALAAVVWTQMHKMRRDIRDAYRRARAFGWHISSDGLPPRTRGLTRYPFTLAKSGEVSLQVVGSWRGLLAESFLLRDPLNEGTRTFYITRLEMRTALPPIEFHPKSNHSRILDVGSDLSLESAAFNARWHVMVADLVYGHAVAHPRLMERLLAARAAEMPITIDGASIYTWTTSMKRAHKRFEESLDLLADIAALIPPHVAREYGVARKASGAVPKPSSPTSGVSTTPFAARKRDGNHLARLSLALAGTFIFSPAAVVVGHMALRAVKRGEANNPRTARFALVLGYLFSPIVVAAYVAVALEDLSSTR